MAYVLDKLTPQHDLSQFFCGRIVLDQWLKFHALEAQKRKTATVYVWRLENFEVVAFFTLISHLAEPDHLPKRFWFIYHTVLGVIVLLLVKTTSGLT